MTPSAAPPSPPRRTRGPRALLVVVQTVSTMVVLVVSLAVLGTFFDAMPGLGLATAIVGLVPTWVTVVAAVGVVLSTTAWLLRRTTFSAVIATVGTMALTGSLVITVRMVAAVNGAGGDVDLLRSLTLATVNEGRADALPVYLRDQGDELNIAVYRPRTADSPAPVLVYIHGGGWTEGTEANRSSDMRWFADQGYLVLSVEYSLSTPDRHLWNVVPQQIGCSLTWITDNAAIYGGDARRVSLTGDSAGGNLAINAAFQQASGTLESACGGTAPEVAAVSVTYPGVDLESIFEGSSAGAGYTTNYTGGTPAQHPDRYRVVSSSSHITSDAPATLVLTGEADHLVPPAGVARFGELLDDAGVDNQFVSVPHADHVFDAVEGNIGDQAYRQLTLNWLEQHG